MDEATGRGRGSARSIQAFNMFEAINQCSDLLHEYGGHAHAAGLSIAAESVDDFSDQMNRIARTQLTEEDCVPTLDVASELPPFRADLRTVAGPGSLAWRHLVNGNPEPHFASRGVRIQEIKRMGAEKQHLKLILNAEGVNPTDLVDAPWWNRGELADVLESGMSMDLCYRPQFNHFNGRRTIQFLLDDIRPADW